MPEIKTDMTKEPVCPYCGYAEPNAWEIDFGGAEGEVITFCSRCEMDYVCSRQITVYYSTTRVVKAKGNES